MRRSRLWFGALYGLVMGVIFSLIAIVILVVNGTDSLTDAGVSVGSALALYIGGGTLGGAAAGFMMPLANRRLGAVAVGMVAMQPFAIGLTATMAYLPPVQPDVSWTVGIILGAAMGGTVGWLVWRPPES